MQFNFFQNRKSLWPSRILQSLIEYCNHWIPSYVIFVWKLKSLWSHTFQSFLDAFLFHLNPTTLAISESMFITRKALERVRTDLKQILLFIDFCSTIYIFITWASAVFSKLELNFIKVFAWFSFTIGIVKRNLKRA